MSLWVDFGRLSISPQISVVKDVDVDSFICLFVVDSLIMWLKASILEQFEERLQYIVNIHKKCLHDQCTINYSSSFPSWMNCIKKHLNENNSWKNKDDC